MNKIRVLFAPGERMIVAPAEFKRNTGQVLEVYGVPFDEGAVLRVAFISDGDEEAVPATGTVENGTLSIPIPDDKFFDLDEDGGDEGRIRAYFAVVDDDSITTEYCVVIPLLDAPPLTDPYEDATPAQRSAIDEIIRQMATTAEAAETAKQKAETAADKSETNVSKYPKIVDGKWYVWDADAGDFVDTGIKAVGEDGKDGQPGAAGKDGVDGVSPTAKVETVSGGAKVTVTDKTGTTTAVLTNGQDGQPGAAGKDGKAGEDGFSPSASVTQTPLGATISITDKTGTTAATILNGTKGETGNSGVYVGSEEPTDENVTVWVDTDGTADEETAEVIIDMTTDEDSAAIVIDRDANGEAFRLKAAKIICLLPASLTEALDYISAKYKAVRVDGGVDTLSLPTLRYPIKTKCALTYEFDGRGGLGFVRGSSASGIGSSSSQHLVMTASWGLNRYISEFQLRQYSASSTLIPAGTRIMIIGIRG